MSTLNKEPLSTLNNNLKDTGTASNLNYDIREDEPGYVKKLLTEQDVCTSGIIYRYINNVDPNKDLICDTAKYGGPLRIVSYTDDENKK